MLPQTTKHIIYKSALIDHHGFLVTYFKREALVSCCTSLIKEADTFAKHSVNGNIS